MVPELHRFHRRCLRLFSRFRPLRRHQDSYSEQELRESRERFPNLVQHGQE